MVWLWETAATPQSCLLALQQHGAIHKGWNGALPFLEQAQPQQRSINCCAGLGRATCLVSANDMAKPVGVCTWVCDVGDQEVCLT